MESLHSYLTVITERAQLLAPLVLVAYVAGAFLARGPFVALLRAGGEVVLRFGRKLDRENRGVATLVYRGIVAVVMLLVPALFAGALLLQPIPWVKALSALLLVIWFGHCFSTLPTLKLWQKAKSEGLPLQIPELDFLFADTHAVIRHLVATRMDTFATGIVGGCFWYIIGGWMLMASYLTLAAAAAAYRPRMAFGWAARNLFALMDFIPRGISRLLLMLAAIFTPHCKPFAGVFAPSWRGAVTQTLDISLNGTAANGDITWSGTGTARLTHQHLGRMLNLILAATLLLVLLLASANIYKLLIKII